MKRSHRGSSRVADRRPRGGRKVGRARNRLSGKRYGKSTANTRSARHGEFAGENMRRHDHKPTRDSHRAQSPAVPAYIRATGVHFGDDERAYTQRKLDQKLGKFAASVERVSIRIDDVNGPRGGIDQKCRIKVVLTGQPSVIVNTQYAEAHAAVDAAIKRVEQAVRSAVRRRRMKPLRARAVA